MARKRSPKPPTPTRRWAGTALRVVVTLAVAAGVAAGLAWLGRQAGGPAAEHPRYALPFADIECDAPPGVPRPVFLAEVRYLGGLGEAFQRLDPAAAERVRAAFAGHPWVEAVTGCGPTPDGRFRVGLRFRTPALAVRGTDGRVRMVDAGGVLLPDGDPPPDLAALAGERPPPATLPGKVWDDPVVRRGAELARQFKAKRVEKRDRNWWVTERSGRVLDVSW